MVRLARFLAGSHGGTRTQASPSPPGAVATVGIKVVGAVLAGDAIVEPVSPGVNQSLTLAQIGPPPSRVIPRGLQQGIKPLILGGVAAHVDVEQIDGGNQRAHLRLCRVSLGAMRWLGGCCWAAGLGWSAKLLAQLQVGRPWALET